MKKTDIDRVDHIVYCTPDLEKGMAHIHELTGIEPSYGGRHLTKGTHNALIKIGHECYLEILSPDPDNHDILPPRWMGIDLIDSPRITRWAIKTSNIEEDAPLLNEYQQDYGYVKTGSRALSDGSTLRWQLTDPLSHPEVEVVPFLLDWQDSTHPTANLSQQCSLISIELYSPSVQSVNKVLHTLDMSVEAMAHTSSAIHIRLETRNGIVSL